MKFDWAPKWAEDFWQYFGPNTRSHCLSDALLDFGRFAAPPTLSSPLDPKKKDPTRMLLHYFSLACHSHLNVVNMAPLCSNGTFIKADLDLDRVKAGGDSGHFAQNYASIQVNSFSLPWSASEYAQIKVH